MLFCYNDLPRIGYFVSGLLDDILQFFLLTAGYINLGYTFVQSVRKSTDFISSIRKAVTHKR